MRCKIFEIKSDVPYSYQKAEAALNDFLSNGYIICHMFQSSSVREGIDHKKEIITIVTVLYKERRKRWRFFPI